MTFHRFEDASIDRVHKVTFPLVRETRCGYWINVWGDDKWVSKTSRKRYAYPTEKLALESYIARKKSQLEILIQRRLNTELRLGFATNFDPKKVKDTQQSKALLCDIWD